MRALSAGGAGEALLHLAGCVPARPLATLRAKAQAAAARNREVVQAALDAARSLGIEVDFVSRSDSTLRGHFPLEPDTIVEELAATRRATDGIVMVPAFGDAGRLTVNSIHYAGNDTSGYVPVGETEFARDATFGYRSSDLCQWIEEKSAGRIPAGEVVALTLTDLRSGTDAVVAKLMSLSDRRCLVVDIIEESDLRGLALGLLRAQAAGKRYMFRSVLPLSAA